MRKKSYFFEHWDWDSILKSFLTIGGSTLLIFVTQFLRKLYYERLPTNFEGSTYAVVADIEEDLNIRQNNFGTRIYPESYTIDYTFELESVTYHSSNKIFVMRKPTLYKKLKATKIGDILEISYDLQDPSFSQLVVED